MGLVDSLLAFNWRIHVLRGGLLTYVPWFDLRFLSQATRVDLDLWLRNLLVLNGRGILWLLAPMGTNVLLGRSSDRELVLCNSIYRTRPLFMVAW